MVSLYTYVCDFVQGAREDSFGGDMSIEKF